MLLRAMAGVARFPRLRDVMGCLAANCLRGADLPEGGGQRAKLSASNQVAKAIAYSLNRWSGLARFLDDGRLCMTNSAAEWALRCVVMLGSLCIPSSSVCKHWKRVVVRDATRATFSGHRRFDRFRRQVVGANLVWRAGHNLHGGQHTGFDQAA